MNYTETFDQFANKLTPTDLALYAGVGMVIWVLFKDKLPPVPAFITNLFQSQPKIETPTVPTLPLNNIFDLKNLNKKDIVIPNVSQGINKDVFFDLIVSWKQTRDLAVKTGCVKAIEVADEMFPFLSPSVCAKKEVKDE
jgi:hypothetical protein